MSELKERVLRFIKENFVEGSYEIENADLLPGGILVHDKKGETMLVYVDLLTDEVKVEFPSK